MKSKLFFKFFVFAVIAAFVTVTSCKDYDDDINDLQKQIADLKTTVTALNTAITNGSVITSVTTITDGNGGIKITLSNGQPYNITNGAAGAAGATGPAGAAGHSPVITIGANGNWFVDGTDTGKPSQGAKGDTGATGPAGGSATIADFYVPNKDGFWHKFVNGQDTGATTDKWLPDGTITALYNEDNGTVTLFNVKGFEGGLVIGGKVLTSVVHYPEWYVGGVEAIVFRPYVFDTRVLGPTDPNECPVAPGTECMAEVGDKYVMDNFEIRGFLSPADVSYNVSPSAITEDMMNLDKLEVTSHLANFISTSYATRLGGVEDDVANPFKAEFVSLAKGKLNVKMSFDPAKLYAAFGEDVINSIFSQNGGYFNSIKWPVLALQVPHSEAAINAYPGLDSYVTSDYVMAVLDPIHSIDIAKKQKSSVYDDEDLLANYLGSKKTGASWEAGEKAGQDNVKLQPDGVNVLTTAGFALNGASLDAKGADYRIIRITEKQTVNLVDSVKAVAEKLMGNGLVAVDNMEEYGFTWKFDVLDSNDKAIEYVLQKNNTEQQKFLDITSSTFGTKGTVKAKVYDATPNGAAVDRSPLVRVRIMSGDCTVSEAFIKILVVPVSTASTKTILVDTRTVASNVGCASVSDTMTVQQVNEKIYNIDLLNGLGLSKDEFHLIYGPHEATNYETEVDVNHIGSFQWLFDKEQGNTTYLPVWTVTPCDIVWCTGEVSRTISTEVLIKPLSTGSAYPTLKIIYNTVLVNPVYKFTSANVIPAYWEKDLSTAYVNSRVPNANENTPATFVYQPNLNALFSANNQFASGLMKFEQNFKQYKYIFAPITEQFADAKVTVVKNGVATEVPVEYRLTANSTVLEARVVVSGTGNTIDGVAYSTSWQTIATIQAHTSNNTTAAATDATRDLIFYSQSTIAEHLLNKGKKYMWAKLQLSVRCCTGTVNEESNTVWASVTFNGDSNFKVTFLRPINAAPIADKSYTDGVGLGNPGSFLALYEDIASLQDFRGYKFSAYPEFFGYYGVNAVSGITVDVTKVLYDAEGPVLKAIPSSIKVQYWTKAQLAASSNAKIAALGTGTGYTMGGVSYDNNGGTVVSTFNLYIPVTITYKWGVIVNEYMKVPVKITPQG